MFNSVVQWGKSVGEPIRWREYTLVPQNRSLRIHFPFGGLVWNRPVAVSVQRADGETQMLSVYDQTRLAQIAIVACAVAAGLVGAAWRARAARSIHTQEIKR